MSLLRVAVEAMRLSRISSAKLAAAPAFLRGSLTEAVERLRGPLNGSGSGTPGFQLQLAGAGMPFPVSFGDAPSSVAGLLQRRRVDDMNEQSLGLPHQQREDEDVHEYADAEAAGRSSSPLSALLDGLFFAAPKRKKSYSRKRMRQMNPLWQNSNASNLYPCPKCDKGYMKLRHHLCPCDAEKINCRGIVKVKYGSAGASAEGAAASAASPAKPAAGAAAAEAQQ